MSSTVVNSSNTESVSVKTGQTRWGHTKLNFTCKDYYRHFDGIGMQVYYCYPKPKGYFPYWYDWVPICQEGACVQKASGEWMRIGGACYRYISSGTFKDAKIKCATAGGTLVNPTTTPLPHFPRQIYQVFWNITEKPVAVKPFWLDAELKGGKWITSKGTEVKNVCFDSVLKGGGTGNCLTSAMTILTPKSNTCNVVRHTCNDDKIHILCQSKEIGCPKDWPGGDRSLAPEGFKYQSPKCSKSDEVPYPTSATCHSGRWGLLPACRKQKGCGSITGVIRMVKIKGKWKRTKLFTHNSKMNFKKYCRPKRGRPKGSRIPIPTLPVVLKCLYGDFFYDVTIDGKVKKQKLTTAEVNTIIKRDGDRGRACQVPHCKTPSHWRKKFEGNLDPSYRMGDEINVNCKTGQKPTKYLLSLNKIIKCGLGHWNANISSSAQLCEDITCRPPYPPVAFRYQYLPYAPGDKTLKVECDKYHGVKLPTGKWSSQLEIQCDLQKEQWVPHTQKCQAYECPKPPKDIGRATVTGSASSIKATCKKEFVYSDGKTHEKQYRCYLDKKGRIGFHGFLTDKKDGTLCGKCAEKLTSSKLPANVEVKSKTDRMITYACKKGFEFADGKASKFTKCVSLPGHVGWLPTLKDLKQCKAIVNNCTTMPDVANAISSRSWLDGSYTCKPGYMFPDRETLKNLTCTAAHGWPFVDNCTEIECTDPPANVSNGNLTKWDTHTATYKCADGYKFDGPDASGLINCTLEGWPTVNCTTTPETTTTTTTTTTGKLPIGNNRVNAKERVSQPTSSSSKGKLPAGNNRANAKDQHGVSQRPLSSSKGKPAGNNRANAKDQRGVSQPPLSSSKGKLPANRHSKDQRVSQPTSSSSKDKSSAGNSFGKKDQRISHGSSSSSKVIPTTTTVAPTAAGSGNRNSNTGGTTGRGTGGSGKGGGGRGSGGSRGGAGNKGGGSGGDSGGGGGGPTMLVQCTDVVKSHGHFKLINDGDFFTGYSAVYMCTDGFVLDNDEDYAMATCTAKGKMAPASLPSCIKKGCPPPPDINYANKSSSLTALKHTVVYTCHEGYEFPNENNVMYTTCSAKGTWVPALPHCQLKTTCKSPPKVTNATKTSHAEKEPVGRINVYSCHAGHRFPNGYKNEYIKCGSRGRWNRIIRNTCKVVHCGELVVPFNASCSITSQEVKDYGDDVVGTAMECRCYWDGARFRDGDITKNPVCLSSGRWSLDLPKCGSAEWCYYPPQLQKAVLLDKRDQRRNSTIRYICEKGYHWPDNETIMTAHCNMSGFWNMQHKLCYPNPCVSIEETLEALHFHSINYSYVYHVHVPVASRYNFSAFYKDTLTVSCPDTTTEFPTGQIERDIKCNHDGTWIPKIPLCVKKRAPFHYHLPEPGEGPMPPMPMIALVFLGVALGAFGFLLLLDIPKVFRDLCTGGRNKF